MIFRGFVAAIRLLTRIPIPGRPTGRSELAASVVWFPVVGSLVGAATAVIVVSSERRLGSPAIVLGLIAAALLTGCIHEDGLADACDGLGGGSTRERRLEIMRDSRIGSYGATALTLLYLARFTLFTALGQNLLLVLPIAYALARSTSVALMAWLPNARGDGLADDVAGSLRPTAVVVSMLVACVIAVAISPRLALPMVAIAVVVTFTSGRYLQRRLGGVTGDVLGAVNVIAEVATLAIAQVVRP